MRLPGFLLTVLPLLAGACTATTEDCYFSAQQRAWKPYQNGQVLRFGRAGSGQVRTFELAVAEQTETLHQGSSAPVYLGPGKNYRLQQVNVSMRRTDTVRYVPTATSTPGRPDSMRFTGYLGLLHLEAGDCLPGGSYDGPLTWDGSFANTLPLAQLQRGFLPDTSQHLLPVAQLGGVAYDSVFRLSSQATTSYWRRSKPVRLLYYARSYGVVGFVEGNTLWYRLP